MIKTLLKSSSLNILIIKFPWIQWSNSQSLASQNLQKRIIQFSSLHKSLEHSHMIIHQIKNRNLELKWILYDYSFLCELHNIIKNDLKHFFFTFIFSFSHSRSILFQLLTIEYRLFLEIPLVNQKIKPMRRLHKH